jgi:hypothetical protein
VTLVDRQIVEPDLGGDAAAAVDVEVGGGAQAIVVDRTGPGAHQKRRTDGDTTARISMSVLTSSNEWGHTHVVRGPHGRGWWG